MLAWPGTPVRQGSRRGDTFKVLRRSRRLARLAACTALALGLAGTAGALSAPAKARVTATLTRYHLVASWGANGNAELGDGTTRS